MDDLKERIKAMRESIGVKSNWIGSEDFELIGCALEAVITDDATREAGLWGGDLLPRALNKLSEVVEKYRPIPVSERLPNGEQHCLVWDGSDWDYAVFDIEGDGAREFTTCAFQPGSFDVADFTHWLPLPPKPETIPAK